MAVAPWPARAAEEPPAEPELREAPASDDEAENESPAPLEIRREPNEQRLPLGALAPTPALPRMPKATLVVASKREGTLRAYAGSLLIFEARARFGAAEGDKSRRGDARTPEGVYPLDYKKSTSRYYKSIHVGYPRPDQRSKASALGIDPGDEILVHGPELGPDGAPGPALERTEGCVALSAADMDALWALVEPGIPIVIEPR